MLNKPIIPSLCDTCIYLMNVKQGGFYCLGKGEGVSRDQMPKTCPLYSAKDVK